MKGAEAGAFSMIVTPSGQLRARTGLSWHVYHPFNEVFCVSGRRGAKVCSMRVTITVEDPTPDVLKHLLAIAAVPDAEVSATPDDQWTPQRARAYYDRLPPRAQEILRQLTAADGSCSADELRRDGKNLRGSTGAFKRVLAEGAKAGLWPTGLQVPVRSVVVGGTLCSIEMPPGERDPLSAFMDALEPILWPTPRHRSDHHPSEPAT